MPGKRPESFYLITWLYDADSPAGHKFVWTWQEALTKVAELPSMASITVKKIHRTKGQLLVLACSPGGLIRAQHYETHAQRWKASYSTEFVDEHLAQWPNPIVPRWRK